MASDLMLLCFPGRSTNNYPSHAEVHLKESGTAVILRIWDQNGEASRASA